MGKKGKKSKRKGRGSVDDKVLDKSSRRSLAQWEIGQRVIISGLKQATRFNGNTGTIISVPTNSGSRYGVSVDGHKIAVLPSNLESSTPDQEICYGLEEQLREENEKTSMDADSMAAMRMMMNMFMTEEHQMKIYGRKIKPLPDFLGELRDDGGGLPNAVNSYWADTYLRTAFEQDSNMPHVFELGLKSPDYEPEPTDILKRLGTNRPDKIRWLLGPRRIGDIFPHEAYPYTSHIRHSYSNQAYRKEVLHLGTIMSPWAL
ncbi:unnamed protein product [Cylindrotheca closterium]|uniref:Uncharacterized protein n=1 Tax=Cylindrotheca closterium TaxID=2856 RepID=A0AAD2G4I0_9STRA|nr:unnamed protein product [Cylindrotheca closterium]